MRNDIESENTVDARKKSMGREEALVLAKTVNEIYSCKGTKITQIDMHKDKPTEATLLEALLGPTGNLRAPTIKLGDVLLVGYNEEVFKKMFKSHAKAR